MYSGARNSLLLCVPIGQEESFHNMDEESTGSNAIWAIALVIIVALIAGLIFYSGMLDGRGADKKIDVDVKVPSAPAR
jgi:hypothetical protein